MNVNFEIVKYRFEDDGLIPNSPLPVLVYRQVCSVKDKSDWFETTFMNNGWTNNWRDIILPYDHFHSTTHEVLGVGRGSVTLRVGGQSGRELTLHAGDVVILPAGVGHCAPTATGDYEIVGGYPEGRAWDLLKGDEQGRDEILMQIKRLPIPLTDPINGEGGTLGKFWQSAEI
jgi:uncharacterized protein YjlB